MRAVARRKPRPTRPSCVHREVQKRRTIERNARYHLRQIDVLASSRHVAMVKAGEGTHRPVHATGVVHIRPSPASRRFVGQAGEVRQPRGGLRDRSERGVVMVPTGMAVARHRHVDDVGFDPAQLVISEPPVPQYPRAEVLDHDIGDADQPLHDLQAFGAPHVQTETLLVDVGVREVSRGIQIDREILRRGGTRQPAALTLWPLDLYDLGTERAEPARGPWPGSHPAEVDYANVFQCTRLRHGVVIPAIPRWPDRRRP